MAELIIGGARSGKSALAEKRALESGLRVVYVATAQAGDAEMARRIAHHRTRRPAAWGCVEAPLALATALQVHAAAAAQAEAGGPFDCALLADETVALLDALPRLPGRILLVSNEVGCGIVPMQPLSRRFADEQGRLNQRVAAACARVTLVAAGLPLELK